MSDSIEQYLDIIRQDIRNVVRIELHDTIKTMVGEEVEERLAPIAQAIGRVNDLNTGGSGLAGEIARQKAKIDQLFTLRNIGTGIALSLSVTGALVWLGIKHTVTGWLDGK